MKLKTEKHFFILPILIFCLTIKNFAQTKYSVDKFDVKISGSSNLHDWTANITGLQGSFIIADTDINNVGITVNAEKIKSSEGRIMDAKMQKALKTEKFPLIFYNSETMKKLSGNEKSFTVQATALLTVAGVKQTIKHKVICKKTKNEIQASGSFFIFMSDYGIKPPTAMFGALKTDNKVKIDFYVIFKQI